MPPGSAIERWTDLWLQVGSKIGVTFQAAEESYDAVTAAGFVNVEQRILKVPLGPWAKDKQYKNWGQWYLAFILQGIEGFAVRSFTEVLGVRFTPSHYQALCAPGLVSSLLAVLTFELRSGASKKLISSSLRCARTCRIRASTPTPSCT